MTGLRAFVARWWPVPPIGYFLTLFASHPGVSVPVLAAAVTLAYVVWQPDNQPARRMAMLATAIALLARLADVPPEASLDYSRRLAGITALLSTCVALLVTTDPVAKG